MFEFIDGRFIFLLELGILIWKKNKDTNKVKEGIKIYFLFYIE